MQWFSIDNLLDDSERMDKSMKQKRNKNYIHKIFDGKNLIIITTKDKDLKIKSYGKGKR